MLITCSVRRASLPLLMLAMLAGCRSERLALAIQPPILSPVQPVVAVMEVLPVRPASRKAIFRRPTAVRRTPVGRRVFRTASPPHNLVAQPVLPIARQAIASRQAPLSKHAPMTFARHKVLLLSGLVVALASIVVALFMPTLGLGLLVGIGGVLLGGVLLFVGYADGYGRDPNGMN